jgi:uncharacterized membrane protein YccC
MQALKLPFLLQMRQASIEWLDTDAPILIYMLKATLAGLIALWISMKLNLPDPRTAIFTVFIVMQPQSGLVFSKSYYRVVGTIVGVGISLLMMGFFAQDPAWFIGFFALWIGICTAAGFKYRNFQAYGFVLAGYTLCIVALPVIETPLEVFDIAISRFSEVVVGIMCATIISDVLFPRHLSTSLLSAERERFGNVLSTLADPDSIFGTKDDIQAQTTRFSSGVVGLNATRINSAYESGADRKDRQHYQHLNHEYMNLSTTFHSLKNMIRAIEPNTSPEMMKVLNDLYSPIASSLNDFRSNTFSADELNQIIQKLLAVKKDIGERVKAEQERLRPILDDDSYDAFTSTANLIIRLLSELHIHCVTYLSLLKHRLSGSTSNELSRIVRFSTHTDNVLVALAALRGSGVLLVTMGFWIATGWPNATQTITLAVVIGLLIGTLPSPLDAVVNFFKGGITAVIFAAVYDFYIIPEFTSDLLSLSLVLAPVLALVAWWSTQPKWSGFALGFVFLFMYECALDPYFKIDPTKFMETSLAYLIGIVFAGAAYLLVNFWSCSLTQNRVAKILRHQIVTVCEGQLTLQRSALESTGRDLVQQFSTQGRLNMRSSRLVFEWLLLTLEIGRAILSIRRSLQRLSPLYQHKEIENALESIRVFFDTPSETLRNALLITLKSSIKELRSCEVPSEKVPSNRLQTIISEFALIRTILLNVDSFPLIKGDSCR